MCYHASTSRRAWDSRCGDPTHKSRKLRGFRFLWRTGERGHFCVRSREGLQQARRGWYRRLWQDEKR